MSPSKGAHISTCGSSDRWLRRTTRRGVAGIRSRATWSRRLPSKVKGFSNLYVGHRWIRRTTRRGVAAIRSRATWSRRLQEVASLTPYEPSTTT